MATPLVVVGIAKAYGSVERLASRIAMIYQKTYTGQTQAVCPFFCGQQQLAGNALTAIGWQYGQGVEVELASLRLIVHAGAPWRLR